MSKENENKVSRSEFVRDSVTTAAVGEVGYMRISWPWVLVIILLTSSVALGQLRGELDGKDRIPCKETPDGAAFARLRTFGYAIAGLSVQIDASTSNIVYMNEHCAQFVTGLVSPPVVSSPGRPSSSWELTTPRGSHSTLTGTGMARTLLLDVADKYTVKFTACPSKCLLQLQGGRVVEVEADFMEITIDATSQAVIPPETNPILPPSAQAPGNGPTPDDADGKCDGSLGWGGVTRPQWRTVNQWQGPQDYELLEGWVANTHVASSDSPLNHFDIDLNIDVEPDSPYNRLLFWPPGRPPTTFQSMTVEWERPNIPEFYWPRFGDRVSAFGFLVHDCGEDPFPTEIHPPVGIAVQRARPVQVSPTRLFPFSPAQCPEPPCRPVLTTVGLNVYVPGIVTDILFNQHGGCIKGCSVLCRVGLAQPYGGPDICGPSPLNRLFEFNIYLPRDPRAIYKAGGRNVPPVPLYYQVVPLGAGGGPDPVIVVVKEGDITYLHVKLDLRGFQGDVYNRRIVAAWVYPSPDNWGLKSWRLAIDSITANRVKNGSWNLWVATNNENQEWTKIFECDECISTGDELTISSLVGRAPWTTGVGGALGPDILLFGGQQIRVHTEGRDAGFSYVTGDALGYVDLPLEQRALPLKHKESCCGDGFHYTLNYRVLEGAPVGPPSLSPAARSLFEAYRLQAGNIRRFPVQARNMRGFPAPIEAHVKHPIADAVLDAGRPAVDLAQTKLFEHHTLEELAFPGISMANLTKLLSVSQDTLEGKKVISTLGTLRKVINAGLGSNARASDIRALPLLLRRLKRAMPETLYNANFRDLGPILSVSGDVNGDGSVDAEDLARLDVAITGTKLLSSEELERARVAGQCGGSTADLKVYREVIAEFIEKVRKYDEEIEMGQRSTPALVKDQCHPGKMVGQALGK